jgi:hypothetical protein
MNILELTDEQLTLVQNALDFYSRIGIGQFDKIKDHPTFEEHLSNEFTIKQGPIEVGDKTQRGLVVEIGKGYIKTKGSWGNGEEIRTWNDVDKIKHSVDYTRFHSRRDEIDRTLTLPRNMLINDFSLSQNGSWGIHNNHVHHTCRMAFDIVQVIRHERWKTREEKTFHTVDSSIHFTHRDDDSSDKIKCILNAKEIA